MTMLDRNVPNFCTWTRAPAAGRRGGGRRGHLGVLSFRRHVTRVTASMGASLHIIGHYCQVFGHAFLPVDVVFSAIPALASRLEPAPATRKDTPMKALRFYAPEDVRLEEVPEPACGPDEVKLRVRNCSTCGTDVKIFHNGHQNLTPPRTIGHEIAGEVVEVGADVNATYGSDWQVGDRAQVIAAVPCGDCYECRKGWMAVCQNQTSVGYQYDGGFAEFMIVPAAGAQGRRAQPDPRQRRLRRGRRPPSRSPARSTPRSCSASRPATRSWSSAPDRSAACTSGSPGASTRSARSTSSTSTPSG